MPSNEELRAPDIGKRYRLVTEQASDMVSLHNPLGVYTWSSPSSRRILGYDPAEPVGLSARSLFHPDDLARIQESHRTILDTSQIPTVTYTIRHRDGRWIWFETTSGTVPTACSVTAAKY